MVSTIVSTRFCLLLGAVVVLTAAAPGTVSFPSPAGDFLLIQHNTERAKSSDGTNAFDRNWADFEAGFGDASLDGKFYWRGLKEMHELTKSGQWELLVRLHWADNERFEPTPSLRGSWGWRLYSGFRVGSSAEGFTLNIAAEKESQDFPQGGSDFLLMSGDSHSWAINGMKFSAQDRDQDRAPVLRICRGQSCAEIVQSRNCADVVGGGWWYNGCGGVRLNIPSPWWFDGFNVANWHYPTETVMAIRQVDINECLSTPCQNGATCEDELDSYACSCAVGFTGTHCEMNIDECASSPCHSGHKCFDLINGYKCHCAPGFRGTNCQIINGGFGSWNTWSSCSRSCEGGTQSRTRQCNNPTPANGGLNCEGLSTESRSCNTGKCPVNGGFGSWNTWSSCSRSCEGGTQSRTRQCNNPTPANGGLNCEGLSTESRSCNTGKCPVNGGFGSWNTWSSCSRSCEGGTHSRYRQCNNPTPDNGGLNCIGLSTESRSCNTGKCPESVELTELASIPIGLQVVRGRNWNDGNEDGGAGNVGVVKSVETESEILKGWLWVQWSGGQEHVHYKAYLATAPATAPGS